LTVKVCLFVFDLCRPFGFSSRSAISFADWKRGQAESQFIGDVELRRVFVSSYQLDSRGKVLQDLSVVLARVFLLHQNRLTLDFEFHSLQRQKGHGNFLVVVLAHRSQLVVASSNFLFHVAVEPREKITRYATWKAQDSIVKKISGACRSPPLGAFFRPRLPLRGGVATQPVLWGNPHKVRLTWSPIDLETTRHPHVPSLAGLDSSLHPDPALRCWASEFRRSATDPWERLAIISPLRIDC
jgi:hypothetical protein